jgi:hypothetical protein
MTPLGICAPILINFFGFLRKSTISWSSSFASFAPATSLKRTRCDQKWCEIYEPIAKARRILHGNFHIIELCGGDTIIVKRLCECVLSFLFRLFFRSVFISNGKVTSLNNYFRNFPLLDILSNFRHRNDHRRCSIFNIKGIKKSDYQKNENSRNDIAPKKFGFFGPTFSFIVFIILAIVSFAFVWIFKKFHNIDVCIEASLYKKTRF